MFSSCGGCAPHTCRVRCCFEDKEAATRQVERCPSGRHDSSSLPPLAACVRDCLYGEALSISRCVYMCVRALPRHTRNQHAPDTSASCQVLPLAGTARQDSCLSCHSRTLQSVRVDFNAEVLRKPAHLVIESVDGAGAGQTETHLVIKSVWI